jgi:hypothetical protein
VRQRLTPVLQIASIALTGWVLWGGRLDPLRGQLSLQTLVFRAALYAVIAWAAGAAITLVLYLGVRQWEHEDVIRATLRTSSAAIWFAPSVILLTALSPAAIAAAMVLIITATRLLYHEWCIKNPARPEPPAPSGLFAAVQLPPPNFWRDVAPGFAASLAIQTGVAAVMLRRPLLAGTAFVMSVSIATLFAMTSRAVPPKQPQSLPRSILGVLLTIVMAVGLTVAGMIPRWMRGDGSGFGFGLGAGNASGSAPVPMRQGYDSSPDLPKATGAALADGGFPGVILWPEIKPYATLIAPMPQRADGLATVEQRPMSIPFSGEYWMFRWPFARPPKTSLVQRGTPSAVSFRTTDQRPLQMEAHHKLDQLVSLDCCRMIQLSIRNADRFPNTISLELVLINNELPASPSVSLGREIVASVPDLRKDPVVAVAEMVSFAIPPSPPIPAFDELKIVFFRDRRRMDQSAKVAIERFVLLPRY